ncbi:hypothetical protein BD324DRAFT_604852 [Kockovaella imperatae]|uniref:Uncharacterized protein n=1 Tax=Kockovaella imperatae TaxID=4999 RepID=A0A1Y1UAM2_9TREE|nr:hypothetical protein BD324DRAFT_604852 [Kockovaella imperatae]ORX34594.1 hypothetical protein BD324DRAFT_604852 [Kockovaella imperatae]
MTEQALKGPKASGKVLSNTKTRGEALDRARMDKQVVKAVMVSPLIVPWPSIPNHLQKAVLSSLPTLIPDSIPAYHVDRARCKHFNQAQRRKEKKRQKAAVDKQLEEENHGEDPRLSTPQRPNDNSFRDSQAIGKADDKPAHPPPKIPEAPDVLQHLIFGINETIKVLERSIDDLKLRLMLMADAINGNLQLATTSLPLNSNGLLPTAPSDSSARTQGISMTESLGARLYPPAFIIVPLLSISPQTLVSAIPQYCATYNALVYQWIQLGKIIETRMKKDQRTIIGEPREEIRVVALGDVELEIARMVGLRRVACTAVRSSHPDLKILSELLPKSALHPPRHQITLPHPTSNVRVHCAQRDRGPAQRGQGPGSSAAVPDEAHDMSPLIPEVHYTPLTIKGITTSAPVDGQARKAKRLEEVRARRKVVKERRRAMRLKEMKLGVKGLKVASNLKSKQNGKTRRSKPAASVA